MDEYEDSGTPIRLINNIKSGERNKTLMITVILTLLLSIAFYGSWSAEYNRISGTGVEISNFILEAFILGILSIMFLFLAVTFNKKNKFTNFILNSLGIALTIAFFFVILYMFLNRLSDNLTKEGLIIKGSMNINLSFIPAILNSGFINLITSLILFILITSMIIFIINKVYHTHKNG